MFDGLGRPLRGHAGVGGVLDRLTVVLVVGGDPLEDHREEAASPVAMMGCGRGGKSFEDGFGRGISSVVEVGDGEDECSF